MASLKSENEIRSWLAPRLEIIVKEIMDGIDKLNDEKIKQKVYDAYSPLVYQREESVEQSFAGAWDSKTEHNSTLGQAKGEFKYAPEKMSTHPIGVHESINSKNAEDSREYLAEIIYEGLSGAMFYQGYAKDAGFTGAWTRKRDAWTALVSAVTPTRMRKWIRQGADKAGLQIRF